MKTGYIRYGYDAALMILSHLTINSMKQFVLFVTSKQTTFNFFRPPQQGPEKIFFRSLRSQTPAPISIFVILTLCTGRDYLIITSLLLVSASAWCSHTSRLSPTSTPIIIAHYSPTDL